MDYSKQLLGKSLRDLTYDDIANFFSTSREESELIEFKSWSSKASENQAWEPIFKSVCAFLNSSGGILIWGAPHGTGKKQSFSGELSGLPSSFDKDTIVRKISSSIIPLASDFKIQLLENTTGKRVCVIEINESQYKPHQFNGIYYMRLDGESRSAPHHYVEALFRRIALPNLEGYLKFEGFNKKIDYEGPRWEFIVSVNIFNFSSTQNEEGVYYKIKSNIARWHSPSWNENSNPKAEYGSGLKNVLHNDVVPVLAYGNPFIKRLQYRFTDHDVDAYGTNFSFSLQFGGKKSPPKVSRYHLIFERKDTEGTLFVSEEDENILVRDDGTTFGMSRTEQLRKILGE